MAFRRAAARFGLGLYLYQKKDKDPYSAPSATPAKRSDPPKTETPKKVIPGRKKSSLPPPPAAKPLLVPHRDQMIVEVSRHRNAMDQGEYQRIRDHYCGGKESDHVTDLELFEFVKALRSQIRPVKFG